ncbi:hypothetical protein QC281_03755 [Streptomyces sp. DH17]|nr:hypothetical protein [Streptomyces sp. DH17]
MKELTAVPYGTRAGGPREVRTAVHTAPAAVPVGAVAARVAG